MRVMFSPIAEGGKEGILITYSWVGGFDPAGYQMQR